MAAGDDGLLPLEIWREILIRVPLKSILRCRSVGKSWYSLISCHYSVRHLNKNGNRVLLQSYDSSGSGFPFSSHDESFMESREHDEVPEAFLGCTVEIVGSCNGLICLSKIEFHGDVRTLTTFLIWNPTIRKVVELPSRPGCLGVNGLIGCDPSYCGFGFDFKTGDFKVMCMHSVYSGRNNCDSSDADANVCEVFDLSKGVWRGISPLVHSWNVGGRTPECYLNGALHWSGYTDGVYSDMILLSFDMSDEIFREIRMPDCAKFLWDGDGDDSHIETRSVTLGGLIHVIVWKFERNDYAYTKCSVLAMKEYGVTESWTILFNLDLVCAELYLATTPKKFRLWENGEVLMMLDLDYGDRHELVLYNTESRTFKQLSSFTTCISDLCLYEESLVLL